MKAVLGRVCGIGLLGLLAGCSLTPDSGLTLFFAPVFSPLMETIKPMAAHELGVKINSQVAGSQMLCRMITELGRESDVVLLADAELFKKIAASHFHWRMEFSHDEMVLGVGIRAKRLDEAEKDWVKALLDPEVQLGRADENLSPLGYRTLLAWKLMELYGHPGLMAALTQKTAKRADQADHLAALLKSGDVDYGFLYRTTCLQTGIRFISLDPKINMGKAGQDYSRAQVQYQPPAKARAIIVRGSLITYGLGIPVNAPRPDKAAEFLSVFLSQPQVWFEQKGYHFFKPQFYGSRTDYPAFQKLSDYAGEF